MTESHPVVVCALYKFVALDQLATLKDITHQKLLEYGLRGTLILAAEGINGTIAGESTAIDQFLRWLCGQPGLDNVETKLSYTDHSPFKRTRVKIKKEIVTMGIEHIDPRKSAGTYVNPEQWNDLIDDPDVLVVDTRNEYEIQVGRFENAVNPHTTNFREFPEFAKASLDPQRHRKIAMYCTGGIRCEKSTAYLREQGFSEVYHLKGGILKYLEKVPKSNTRWQGECFVFDERVTVDHNLQKGSYDQCHACRRPVTDEDRKSPYYLAGKSCPACFNERTEEDRMRYGEREKQVRLAEQRGQVHIGPPMEKPKN